MAKGKQVSVKYCLELMRKYEAVEATMKKFEESSDTQVDASFALDPTKKSQKNGSRKLPYKPKFNPDGKRSGGKKPCIWCNRDAHSRDECPAKDATCTFCGKQGHFERACLQKKGIDKAKKSKRQLAVGVEPDKDSSECEYDFDFSVVSIHAVDNEKSLAPVLFHPKGNSSPSYEINSKVETGAMVSCMPTFIFSKIGLSKKDLKPSSDIISFQLPRNY